MNRPLHRRAGARRRGIALPRPPPQRGRGAGRGRALPPAIFPRFSFDLHLRAPRPHGRGLARQNSPRARLLGASTSRSTNSRSSPALRFHTAYEPRGLSNCPTADIGADLYEATLDLLGAAGLPAYEISNHAKPGAESRHNLTYWRYGDYVGIGPGAHGRLTHAGEKYAIRHHARPRSGRSASSAAATGETERKPLDASPSRGREMLLMGLRLAEGVDLARFEREAGQKAADFVNAKAATRLAETGLIEWTAEALRATTAGRQRLNAVLTALTSS